MALYSSSFVLKWRKMIASFTSASVAKSRVVVPLNPFFPNNSIAVAMICCRRSRFISKYLLTLSYESVQEKYLQRLIRNWRVIDQLNQESVGVMKIKGSCPVPVGLGFLNQAEAMASNLFGPPIDIFRTPDNEPDMMNRLDPARFDSWWKLMEGEVVLP